MHDALEPEWEIETSEIYDMPISVMKMLQMDNV
jgi:hypothetical protein